MRLKQFSEEKVCSNCIDSGELWAVVILEGGHMSLRKEVFKKHVRYDYIFYSRGGVIKGIRKYTDLLKKMECFDNGSQKVFVVNMIN